MHRRLVRRRQPERPRRAVLFRVRKHLRQQLRLLGVDARGQAILIRRDEPMHDALDPAAASCLRRRSLRESRSAVPIQIDLGKPQIDHVALLNMVQRRRPR